MRRGTLLIGGVALGGLCISMGVHFFVSEVRWLRLSRTVAVTGIAVVLVALSEAVLFAPYGSFITSWLVSESPEKYALAGIVLGFGGNAVLGLHFGFVLRLYQK